MGPDVRYAPSGLFRTMSLTMICGFAVFNAVRKTLAFSSTGDSPTPTTASPC